MPDEAPRGEQNTSDTFSSSNDLDENSKPGGISTTDSIER